MSDRSDSETSNGTARRGRVSRVTMDMVAEQAKVSPSTVSLFLRDPDAVSSKRAERIRQAIADTGYTINRLAGALAGSHSRAVAVIVPSMINAFFSETLQAMQEVFETRGYQLLISNSDYDPQRELELLRAHLSWSPAALVVTGSDHAAARPLLEATGIPVAQMWELGNDPFHLQVGFYHEAAGAALAEHLHAQGLEHYLYVGTRMHLDHRARKRAEGFSAWLAEKGQAAQVIALEQNTSQAELSEVFEQIARNGSGPQGLCCSNDVLAIAALFEAQRRGIAVPEQLAITGFGDLPLSKLSAPRLTTVRPFPAEIGRTVATRLLSWIEAGTLPDQPEVVDLGFELVVRESSVRG
ncbi:Catabolite control protein A [Pseudomonas reidholzensis]|uniref:Catabolite control protein A n=1 Tax=Pseudomonas reidholzensis TaxID=1785162 RepID=A0A383RUU2_9PSED|nr:LacI family DNA-binding transcriptional regulator [Pseudomonas reidholzensis]SYX90840.1 Catabolite control protein A [Pseudomonas reidholzensis]